MADVPDSGQVVSNAYHGTSLEAWESILSDDIKFRLPPKDAPNAREKWFGQGIYFYDGDPDMAKFWPKDAPPGTKCVILQATVNLGRLLDVQVTAVKKAIERAATRMVNENVPWQQITSATVIDFLARKLNFDTVRGTGQVLSTPVRIHKMVKIPDLGALIICVKNVDMISDVRKVVDHLKA